MSQSFVRSSTSIPANTSVTEKRTVITTSSGLSGGFGGAGADDDDSTMYYRSSITPRQTSITRTSLPTSPLRSTRTVDLSSAFPSMHMPLGSATVAATGVISFKSNREKEKKDMQDLNERFANYIEKVRFLEAQNKKLASELEQLRSHWGKETNKIKLMYETELTEARKLIDDTNKEKSRLQLRVGQLEEQLDDVMRQLDEAKKWRSQDRETINKLNQQVSELEGEVRMLRRTNDSLDTERQRDKATINRLQEELEKLRIDLSNETIARLDAENKYQTLLEEMEFLKSVHEQELKELSALAYRDTTAENREFWKNELSQAIRDIQQEYDMKVDQIRGEMETFYNLKVQEFRTGATKQNMEVTHAREETKKLHKQLGDLRTRNSDLEARNAQLEKQYQDMLREMEQKDHEHVMEINSLKEEMNKLRAELEAMLIELQILMDAKLSLELEIAAYRKLLEGEETRIPLRNSYRHSYTPYSAPANKTGSNGAPYGAPASSSKYSYISSRDRDTTSPSKVKATEMADSKPKASPEPLKVEADSKAAVSADIPLVKKSDKEETQFNEKRSVASKSFTPVKQEQETIHKTEMSQKLFQEKGETVKDEKTESGDESQWEKDIEGDIIMKQTVKDIQETSQSLEEEIVCQTTDVVMMEPVFEPRDEEVSEEKATVSVAGEVKEKVVMIEKHEDQAENVPMEIEEEMMYVTQISEEHSQPQLELSTQDVENALSEDQLKESEGDAIISTKAQAEEPGEGENKELDVVATGTLESAMPTKDSDEANKDSLTIEESQLEATAEAPMLPHTPSPSPTDKYAKVSEETILDQALKKVAEQTAAQTATQGKVTAEDKTIESETKVDVVKDISPVKEDIQEAPHVTETKSTILSAEKEDTDETVSAEEVIETISTVLSAEKEDKDEIISAEETAETTFTVLSSGKKDKHEAISSKEVLDTTTAVLSAKKEDEDEIVSAEKEDKDEPVSAEEVIKTTPTVLSSEKKDKDETIFSKEVIETISTVLSAEKEDKDETTSAKEVIEKTPAVLSAEKEDKDETTSAKEVIEKTTTVLSAEKEDQDETTSAKEVMEKTTTVLSAEKEDQDEQISSKEAIETTPTVLSAEKEDKDETTSAKEVIETTPTVLSAEKEDKDETISSKEVIETTPKVLSAEKEDKDETTSAKEVIETTPTVLSAEKEDQDEQTSSKEVIETTPTVLSAEKEDQDEQISSKEAIETTPTVLSAQKEDKDETISAKEVIETTPTVLSAEKEDKDETITSKEVTETKATVLSAEKEDKDKTTSAEETTLTVLSAEKEDKDETISSKEVTEITARVLSAEKEDKDETTSAEETTLTVLSAEKEDKDETISSKEVTETTAMVLSAEKEDKDETSSAKEVMETISTVLSAEKEDKDEKTSAKELIETTPTVLTSEMKDKDETIFSKEVIETASTFLSSEKEDKDEKTSAKELIETAPTVLMSEMKDKDETISSKEVTETTITALSSEKKDKDEITSAEKVIGTISTVVSAEKEDKDETISSKEVIETTPTVLSAEKEDKGDTTSTEEEIVSLERKASADEETVFLEKEVLDVTESETEPTHEISHEDQESVTTTHKEEDVVETEIVEQIAKDVEDSHKQHIESRIENSQLTEVSDSLEKEEMSKETMDPYLETFDHPAEEHEEERNKEFVNVTSVDVKGNLLLTSADEELKNLSKSIVEGTVEEAIGKEVAMKAEGISVETEDETAKEENITQYNEEEEEEETFITETYFVSLDGRITEDKSGNMASRLEQGTSSDGRSTGETTESDSVVQVLSKTQAESTSSQISSQKVSADSEMTLGEHEKVRKGDVEMDVTVTSTTVDMEVKDVEVFDKKTDTSGAEDEESKDVDCDVVSYVADVAAEGKEMENVDDKERKVIEKEDVKTDEVQTGEKGEVEISGLSGSESQEKILLDRKDIPLEIKSEKAELQTSKEGCSEGPDGISSESLTEVAATTKDVDIKEDLGGIHVGTNAEETVKGVEKDNGLEAENVEEIQDKEQLEVDEEQLDVDEVTGKNETDSVVESIKDENVKSFTERVNDIDDVRRSDTVDKSDDKESIESNELIMKEEEADIQGSDRQKSPAAEKSADEPGKDTAKEEVFSGSGIKADKSNIPECEECVSKEEVVVGLTKILTTEQVVKDASSESLLEETVRIEAEKSMPSKHTDVLEKHLIAESVTGESIEDQATEMASHESGQSVSIKQTISEHHETLSMKRKADELEISPGITDEPADHTALIPSEFSIAKSHSSQQEIVHTTSMSHTTKVQQTETKVVTSVVTSTKESKLIGSSSGTDAHSFQVTSFMSNDDLWEEDKKESDPSRKISEKEEHFEVFEEHSEDGKVVKVERKVHEQSQVVLESSSSQRVKGDALNLGFHEDSADVVSQTITTASENETIIKHKEDKVNGSLSQSPPAEEDVIISKTFSLSESSAKFLSESGFIKDDLGGTAMELQDPIAKESSGVDIRDGEQEKQRESEKPNEKAQEVLLQKSHSIAQQDSSQTDGKSQELTKGEKELTDQSDSEQHLEKAQDIISKSQSTVKQDTSQTETKSEVSTGDQSGSTTGDIEATIKDHAEQDQTAPDTRTDQHLLDDPPLEKHPSINEKTCSDGSLPKDQEKVEMHCDIMVTDVSDEEGTRSTHHIDVKDDTKGSTGFSAHVEINIQEEHDDDVGDLEETAEVRDVDDEIEEESLLVNGVKEDLLEASSPEISTFDQARADISIATPLPGDEKGIHDDTDDDVLNDAEMANGGDGDDADGVTAEAGPGADEDSPTDTDTVSLHDVSGSTEVHSQVKEGSEATQKAQETLTQEGGISALRDLQSNDKTPSADTVDTHTQQRDGHTDRFESYLTTTDEEVRRADPMKSIPPGSVHNGDENESEIADGSSTELSFQLKSEVVSEATKVTPEQVKEVTASSGEVQVGLNGDTTSGNIAVVSSEAASESKQT